MFENQNVKILPFIKDMNSAFMAADFIISRAGASSISELCVVGKPTLFIPSPNVAADHQTKNAMALVDAGAALMVKEKELNDSFDQKFEAMVTNEEEQHRLMRGLDKLSRPNATQSIVDEIEKLIGLK